ncbi:head-tail connector protein [Acerihabitans sp. KWT182]|uniref:Head-tail connector protein n=1 Tax=Acerihabitans sp. KWT182 TaxID=3157919 RepID=A0AAU7QDC5_9GAMM
MIATIDLSVVKAHCRIDPEFTGDDPLLTLFTGAAARYVQSSTRRTLYASETDPGFDTDKNALLLDDDIRMAMLLCIGNWYANREVSVIGDTAVELPLAVDALLQPYRIYGL